MSIVRWREVDIVPAGVIVAKEVDVDFLPVPYDVLDNHAEGKTLLLHGHIVHRTGKGLEHIPQHFKRLRLQVLLL